MSEELAAALDASNSEDELRRFEELMGRDVEPMESFEEFSERYSPYFNDSTRSIKKLYSSEYSVKNHFDHIDRVSSGADLINENFNTISSIDSNVNFLFDSFEPHIHLLDDAIGSERLSSLPLSLNFNIFIKDEEKLNMSRDNRSP